MTQTTNWTLQCIELEASQLLELKQILADHQQASQTLTQLQTDERDHLTKRDSVGNVDQLKLMLKHTEQKQQLSTEFGEEYRRLQQCHDHQRTALNQRIALDKIRLN